MNPVESRKFCMTLQKPLRTTLWQQHPLSRLLPHGDEKVASVSFFDSADAYQRRHDAYGRVEPRVMI
jgi:hypothetical protein